MVEPGDFKTSFTKKREISKNANQSDTFQNTLQIIENDENSGQDPIMIGKLINNIIKKANPRLRYTVGTFDQKLATFLKRILPNRLFDWIIMKHYKVV